MHIPDGYLGPWTYGGLWGAMAPAWWLALRKAGRELDAARVPRLALGAAFSFLVMLFAVPLPGGTTGHITGAPLLAILLGPGPALLAVSIALAIQALLLGDGGVTALGANAFNIALAGSLIGHGVHAAARRWAGRRAAGGREDRGAGAEGGEALERLATFHPLAAGVGAYLAANAGALLAALELGVQPLLHAGRDGAPLYFPFPLKVTIPALVLPHLAAVGILEGAVTALALAAVDRARRPGAARPARPGLVLLAGAALAAAPAFAHEFSIEPAWEEFVLVYGHGGSRLEFDGDMVKAARAFDARGNPLAVATGKRGKELVLKPSGSAAVIVSEIDGGCWSKTIYGWKNLPRRKASRVVEARRERSFPKAIGSWRPRAAAPAGGLPLEIVPLADRSAAGPGGTIALRVLCDGAPCPGAEVIGSDHGSLGATNAEGLVNVAATRGRRTVAVTRTLPLSGDPDADVLVVTATLSFGAGP